MWCKPALENAALDMLQDDLENPYSAAFSRAGLHHILSALKSCKDDAPVASVRSQKDGEKWTYPVFSYNFSWKTFK